MKKIISLVMAVLMLASLSLTVFADCPNPQCFSTAKSAYCGGGDDETGFKHIVTYYVPFWPFGKTEEPCEYAYIYGHDTYGICGGCGTQYPAGSDVFSDHGGECAHTHVECDGPKTPLCSYGDYLSWFF